MGNKSYQLIIEEQGYSGYLITLGKIDYFEEKFYNEKLSDDVIKSMIPLDNPRKTKSFIYGRKMAIALEKQGFSEKEYSTFLKNLNKSFFRKIEKTEFNETIKHR